MNSGYFITGTDTAVGKTIVTSALLQGFRAKGIDAVPVKPVQTGHVDASDVSSDLSTVIKLSGWSPSLDERSLMCPVCLPDPCSPHLAARRAGKNLSVKELASAVSELRSRHEMVLVEGAGGLLVPLNDDATMLDLVKALDLPVILVGRTGLGTINHTLMSIQVIRYEGLDLAGVILNDAVAANEMERYIAEDNIETISSLGETRILGILPHQDRLDSESLARAVSQDLAEGMEVLLRHGQ